MQSPQTLFEWHYDALQKSENLFFAASPFPLEPVKAGLKHIGVPLAVSAVAAHSPVVGAAITTATHWGGEMLSNLATHVVSGGLDYVGQNLTANLREAAAAAPVPPTDGGFFAQLGHGISKVGHEINAKVIDDQLVTARWMGQGITNTALSITSHSAHAIGAVSSSWMMGREVLRGAATLTRSPLRQSFVEMQQTIANVQRWLRQTAVKVQQLIGNTVMSQNQTPDPNSPQDPLTPAPESPSVQSSEDLSANDIWSEEPSPVPLNAHSELDPSSDAPVLSDLSESEVLSDDLWADDPVDPEHSEQIEPPLSTAATQNVVGADVEVPSLGQRAGQLWNGLGEALQGLTNGHHSNGHHDAEAAPLTIAVDTADEPILTPPVTEVADESPLARVDDTAEESQALDVPEYDGERLALDIQNVLAGRGLKVDSFEVLSDGQSVFQMHHGDIARNTIDPETAKMLHQALKDPQNLKGSVKITKGNEVLFHVKDGKILVDSFNLSGQSHKVTAESPLDGPAEKPLNSPAESPLHGLYQKASANVDGGGIGRMGEIAVNALNQPNTDPAQVREMLATYSESFKAMAARDPVRAAKTLDQVMEHAQRKTDPSIQAAASAAMKRTREPVAGPTR